MLKFLNIFLFISLFFTSSLFAIKSSELPSALKEWEAWVLDDAKEHNCPVNFQNNTPICTYPTRIDVTMHESYLTFKMKVTLFKNHEKIILPKLYQNWISTLTVDGERKALLGEREAMVFLDEGEHTIEGTIEWREEPKYLQLPNNIALVTLTVNNHKITTPKVDKESRLWLMQKEKSGQTKGTLSVSIYRKLMDGHPMKMKSILNFRVSGKMRSVTLDGIVLDGFYPSALQGDLDAKITKDKKLKVEVKAGEWQLTVDSFSPNNIKTLPLPTHSFNYANQETLSLQHNADYRTIEIENAVAIDPTQSNIPSQWRSLPLYLLERDKPITIKELYKSAKQEQLKHFALQREVWLDFNGKGYSLKDTIHANISKVQRLESGDNLILGSVTINGKPMLINTLQATPNKGVELREKELTIEASSRYEGAISKLPANGWREELDTVTTTLHLPAGWRLFASFGSDSQESKAWIEKWNLMDIFLLLLLTISIYQIFGLKWALPATLVFILIWHEYHAPTYSWLLILALVALIRLLGEGKLKKILQVIFALSILFVTFNVLQFSVSKFRTTLYPQLEKRYYSPTSSHPRYDYSNDTIEHYEEAVVASSNPYSMSKRIPREIKSYKKDKNMQIMKQEQILLQNKIDPNAIVQTGEGTPIWRWSSHTFHWQSTVGSNEILELWFITPTMSKIINILSIFGMLFLLYMFLKDFINLQLQSVKEKLFKRETLQALLFVILFIGATPSLNASEIPSAELLTQLKEKLLKKPNCLPHCASIESVTILVKEHRLQIAMNISTGRTVAVPIVGNRNIWLPETVIVDDSNSSHLQLDGQGNLWVMLERGVHQLLLEGSIKGVNKLMLSPQLALHNVQIEESQGWRINSDHKSYIEIVNLDKKVELGLAKIQSAIEPMVEIRRTFYFGLRWYVETSVKLLNKIDKPYTLTYALLPNESILNKGIEVKDAKAILHLRNSHASYAWRSSLPITSTLALHASAKEQVTEIWKMDIASIWNMRHTGVESEKQFANNNLLMPTFRPWRDEQLTLTLEKTKAVQGESLTIKSSQLEVVQSQRFRNLTLTMTLQSSRAEQYVVELENLKELSSVTVDGVQYYLKINNNRLSIPLKAKSQQVILKWKEERGTATLYAFSNINLHKHSVNSTINLKLPHDRWILWTKGPLLGPAVLLWGVLLSILLFALILGRVKGSPLKVRDWLLLGLGVSTSSIMIMIPIVLWIFLLRYKEQQGELLQGRVRNLVQVLIVLLTLVALFTIIGAVSMGLLGNPDMMIQGNNSYNFNLNWYSDRIGESLPQPVVVSVSIWYYRALMLLWSIWISFSLISWLKWAWSLFSMGDMWVKRPKKEPKKNKPLEKETLNETL